MKMVCVVSVAPVTTTHGMSTSAFCLLVPQVHRPDAKRRQRLPLADYHGTADPVAAAPTSQHGIGAFQRVRQRFLLVERLSVE